MNSRKLIGLISSFGLILVLAVVPVISACAPEEEVTPPPPPPTGPTGELVVLFPDLGSEVWGNDVGGGIDDNIRAFTNERLLRAPIEGEESVYQPGLAERWEMSEDGLTWDFYLRQGVQFHKGWGEFTAEDVLFSFLEIGKPGSTNGLAGTFRIGEGGDMGKYEIIDPYHLRMTLLSPSQEFRMGWALSGVDSTMLSKNYYETVGYDYAIQNPVGTGPWQLIEHKPAEYMKYEAVENHWRQTPAFKYLTVKGVPEPSSRLAMLKTGAADLVHIDIENMAELEAAGLNIKSSTGAGAVEFQLGGLVLPTREHYDPTVPWVMHQDEPESYYDFKAGEIVEGSEWNTRALKVRMAFFHAINYDAIIDTIFYGEGVRHQVFQFGAAGTPGSGERYTRSFEEWPLTPYDPERARELLVEAGYPDGFELTFHSYPDIRQPKAAEIAEAVTMDLEAIGLTVKRDMTEYAVIRSIWVNRDSAWRVMLRLRINPEPAVALPFTNNTRNAGYLDGFESYDFDKHIDRMKSTLIFDEHKEAVKEAGDYLIARFITAPMVVTSMIIALNPAKIDEYPTILPAFSFDLGGYEYVTRP